MITSKHIIDRAAAQRFLQELPVHILARGTDYYHAGRVLRVGGSEGGDEFFADVRGTRIYEVTLFYEKGEWYADCTCPMATDCKHGAAAMLAVFALAGGVASVRENNLRSAMRIESELVRALGHKLSAEQQRYVRKIRDWLYRYRQGSGVKLYQLQELAPELRGNDWENVPIWPTPPNNEVEAWQYLAYCLQERGAPVPEFMWSIAKSATVEKIIGTWRRQQEVENWRERLREFSSEGWEHSAARSDSPLDLRLRIGGNQIVLEGRTDPHAPFQALKPARFKQFAEAFANGQLTVGTEAFPLWHPFYAHWDHRGYGSFRLEDAEIRMLVGNLLRQPILRERIVTGSGAPLVWPSEPLRWQLSEAHDTKADYDLNLVTPDGTPLVSPLLTFPGQPTLYLTETTVWQGPPSLRNGTALAASVHIPAPALESADGVALLTRLGVKLPPRLQERTRQVVLTVKIYCELKPTYRGSETESLYVRVLAEAPKPKQSEHYTPQGWQQAHETTARREEKTFYQIDRSALATVPAQIDALGAKWDYNQAWRVNLTKKFPEKFVPWLAALPPHFEVHLDPALATLRHAPVAAKIKLDCAPSGVDWFDLRVVLDVSDTELTANEVKALLDARGGYVRLGAKGWRRLEFHLDEQDDQQLARLGLNPREFSSEPQRLHALQLADTAVARFLPEPQVASIRRRADEIQTRVVPPVPTTLHAQLRPYQIEGFHFLAYLSANRFGGILADDMGLGKTLQTLCWLAWLRAQEANRGKPVLVVCPKSVMDNWRTESARFAPELHVELWHNAKSATLLQTLKTCDLLVLNYAQLRSLSATLTGIEWLAVILDEGQSIKNPQSLTARAARALKAEHRLILTGTPIENRLLDLWSLMAFAMPGALGPHGQFAKNFDSATDPLARQRLAARVRPFVLRRTKGQVATELPDRVEEDLLCEMEGIQQTLYRAELKHAQQMLLKIKTRQDFDRQRFHFLTSLLRLRQICCHPVLVDPQQADAPSAKLEALLELLEPIMEEGHKVLVFSQFVTVLDLIRPLLQNRGWTHFTLTGQTENRGELVSNFQTTEGAAVFLISLKAGGFGLNLTAASYVVLFDPWWNPAVENQAIDRTHRIGQTRPVNAYRLLMKDSIEEKIRALQKQKRALAEDILGEENFAKALTLEDLRSLFSLDA